MSRGIPGLVASVLAAAAAVACTTPGPVFVGRWVGDAQLGSGTDRLEIAIDSSGRAALSLRSWGLDVARATLAVKGQDTLTLTAVAGGDTSVFRGAAGDGTWAGVAIKGTDTARFEAKRLHPMLAADWEHIVGTYSTGRGRLFGIGHLSEFGDQPMLVDYQTGRIGPLFPLSERVFLYGSSVIAPILPGDTADLAADGLRLVEAGKAPVVAVRLRTRDLPVTFANAAVMLAGTLTLPAGSRPTSPCSRETSSPASASSPIAPTSFGTRSGCGGRARPGGSCHRWRPRLRRRSRS